LPRPFIPAAAESKLYDWNKYSFGYFINGALAGGICCSVTHGGMCPVDVVKTRIQLDPVTYNQGLIGGIKQVVAAEGTGALATGLGPTAIGYFIQGELTTSQPAWRSNPHPNAPLPSLVLFFACRAVERAFPDDAILPPCLPR